MNSNKPYLRAVCFSEECLKKYGKSAVAVSSGMRAVVKNVPFSTTFCRDCEHALFWERLSPYLLKKLKIRGPKRKKKVTEYDSPASILA